MQGMEQGLQLAAQRSAILFAKRRQHPAFQAGGGRVATAQELLAQRSHVDADDASVGGVRLAFDPTLGFHGLDHFVCRLRRNQRTLRQLGIGKLAVAGQGRQRRVLSHRQPDGGDDVSQMAVDRVVQAADQISDAERLLCCLCAG